MSENFNHNQKTSDYLCEIINSHTEINNTDIIHVLKNVFDPDIHYSVYDIGLIYKIIVHEGKIDVIMTLTSVNCPEAQSLPEEIAHSLEETFQNFTVTVDVTFEPMWTVDNMSEEIKLSLGLL